MPTPCCLIPDGCGLCPDRSLGFLVNMRRWILLLLDDVLLVAGCGCVLYGLSLWSAIVTWIAAGLMLIGLAVLVGMRKARNVTE